MLTDKLHTLLLGLDGAASIGGTQRPYRILDEDGLVRMVTSRPRHGNKAIIVRNKFLIPRTQFRDFLNELVHELGR